MWSSIQSAGTILDMALSLKLFTRTARIAVSLEVLMLQLVCLQDIASCLKISGGGWRRMDLDHALRSADDVLAMELLLPEESTKPRIRTRALIQLKEWHIAAKVLDVAWYESDGMDIQIQQLRRHVT